MHKVEENALPPQGVVSQQDQIKIQLKMFCIDKALVINNPTIIGSTTTAEQVVASAKEIEKYINE